MLYLKTLYGYPDIRMWWTVTVLINFLLICSNDFFFRNESVVETN